MRFRLSLILSICCIAVFATEQVRRIEWLPVEKWNTFENEKNVLAFADCKYLDYTGIPYFEEEVLSENVLLTQCDFEVCSSDEISVLKASNLSFAENVSWKVVCKTEQRHSRYFLQINPIVFQDGVYKKLVTFAYETVAAPKRLTTNSMQAAEPVSSVLSTGTWYKIKIQESGIYRLSAADLAAMGCTASNVRIFGYGGAMLNEDFSLPYYNDLPELAIWRGKDYVLFYAQGTTKWDFDSKTKTMIHTRNAYSDVGYYFVTKDAGVAKTIAMGTAETAEPTQTLNTFVEPFAYEADEVSLLNSGREFYGDKLSASVKEVLYNHAFSNVVLDKKSTLRVNLAANSVIQSRFSMKVNGVEVGSLRVAPPVSSYNVAEPGDTLMSFYPTSGERLDVKIEYTNPQVASAAYLNYYELNVQRALRMTGNAMSFRNIDYSNRYYSICCKYQLENALSGVEVWNVTNQDSVFRMPTTQEGSALTFVKYAYPVQEFVAVRTNADFPSPELVGQVANQDLHGLPMCDMVIISHSDFMSEAERLAEAHWQMSGLRVHVVSAEQVYNEFSSGNPDATAYRRLMKMFYDRLDNPKEQMLYLLLMGDGHFDNKGITDAIPETHRLLTYQSKNSLYEMQSYTTDDYFCLMDDSEGRDVLKDKMDISVGRFPVKTKAEAAAVVDKTIDYMQDTHKGQWKTKLCFLADDGDSNSHVTEADSVSSVFFRNDTNYLLKKIYLDAYEQKISASGESYPLANEVFQNLVKTGALMFNYTGHGGSANWSNEALLSMYDIGNMYNKALGFWVAATCNFGHWDIAKTSGAEALLLRPEGGSIATFSASRTVYSNLNYRLNKQLAMHFFLKENGSHLRLGDIVRRAKNKTDETVNKLTFTLLGDPALLLHYPDQFSVVTDAINGRPLEQQDTLNALGEVVITGHIDDGSGAVVSDFNGYVHVSVMDKEETLSTLANDVGSKPFVYQDRPNMLFMGKTIVNNGYFELVFRVPKDIKYTYGKGRIVYYAADETNGYDANGSTTQFVVGGESDDYTLEYDSPQVTLYLNAPDFRSGDIVNETPLFVANIEDESGINATGSGIGHDIIIRLNEDTQQETILNDYYESEIGTYKRGTIKYKMPEMEYGRYSLFFRVWDLQNNSTTVTIGFEVQKGYQPYVYSLTCYPNPTSDVVYFVYEHNRPDEVLEFTANIYDLNGQMLWTSTKSVVSQGNRTEPIVWNLKDDNGQRVRAGIYLMRMFAATPEGEKAANTVKIIVKGQ